MSGQSPSVLSNATNWCLLNTTQNMGILCCLNAKCAWMCHLLLAIKAERVLLGKC